MPDITATLKRELTELRDTALELGLGVLTDLKEAGQFINTGTAEQPNFIQASSTMIKRNPGKVMTLYFLPME